MRELTAATNYSQGGADEVAWGKTMWRASERWRERTRRNPKLCALRSVTGPGTGSGSGFHEHSSRRHERRWRWEGRGEEMASATGCADARGEFMGENSCWRWGSWCWRNGWETMERAPVTGWHLPSGWEGELIDRSIDWLIAGRGGIFRDDDCLFAWLVGTRASKVVGWAGGWILELV